MFEQVSAPNQHKQNKGAVINIDDPHGERVMTKNSAPLITYGTKGKGTLEGENLTITLRRAPMILCMKVKNIRFTCVLPVFSMCITPWRPSVLVSLKA